METQGSDQVAGNAAPIDVDAIVTSIETTGEAPKSQAPSPKVEPQKAQEYEYDWNGKKIKEPIDMVLKRASMGYDYAQKMGTFNQEKTKWEADIKAAKEAAARWQPYEDYAKQNPAWKDHVQQMWEQRSALEGGQTPVTDPVQLKIQTLEKTISELQSAINGQVLPTLQEQRQKAEDAQLKSQMDTIRQKYPDIDLSQADASGRTLEYRVVEHAVKNNLPFNAAFLELNHDRIVSLATEKAKEAVAKNVKQAGQAGLVGKSQSPTMQIKPLQNAKLSYEQILEQTLQEIGAV